MEFSSLSEFIAMGKHGFYVWLSYGFCTAILGILIFSSSNATKKIKKQIADREKREQKLRQAAQQAQSEVER